MTRKTFVRSEQLLRDSYQLAAKIIESGFRPSFIVAVWRGGTPVGIAVQELLEYCGISSDHIAIRTSSYLGVDERDSQVRVHGMNYLLKNISAEDALLIIDDVHDTGLSIQEVMQRLKTHCQENTPHDIRVATVYYKPNKSQVASPPDYYIHETDDWLVFPHELAGLSRDEILHHKPKSTRFGICYCNIMLNRGACLVICPVHKFTRRS